MVPAAAAVALLAGWMATVATPTPLETSTQPTSEIHATTPTHPTEPTPASLTPAATPAALPGPTEVAFITDYGNCDEGARAVADMVDSWQVDAVMTGGDNTQGETACRAYTQSVAPYYGKYFSDHDRPRLFPALGNHDYDNETAGLAAYTRAFPYLPTDADPHGRWYEKTIGDITFFVLDTESRPGDQRAQQDWLEEAMSTSRSEHPDMWRVVIAHRPPYSSGVHGPWPAMQPDAGWALGDWGADLVLSGHQHVYEDVVVDGLHHITGTTGAGKTVRECGDPVEGSRVCVEGAGALRIEATATRLTVELHHPADETAKDRVTLIR